MKDYLAQVKEYQIQEGGKALSNAVEKLSWIMARLQDDLEKLKKIENADPNASKLFRQARLQFPLQDMSKALQIQEDVAQMATELVQINMGSFADNMNRVRNCAATYQMASSMDKKMEVAE